MAIERSRTETIRDFTVHTSGGFGQSRWGGWRGESSGGRSVPFLAMATLCGVVAGGNTGVGADDDGRRARF